jgi:small subunit ribosomal protein S17
MEEKKPKKVKGRKKNVVGTRGRIFEGYVAKRFPTRIVVEVERIVHVPKYERFYKKKSRLHARVPKGLEVTEGDYVKIQECRPLSKIIHFILLEVLKKVEEIK